MSLAFFPFTPHPTPAKVQFRLFEASPNSIPGLCASEERNFNLPYIYQNCKGSASQIKREQDKRILWQPIVPVTIK